MKKSMKVIYIGLFVILLTGCNENNDKSISTIDSNTDENIVLLESKLERDLNPKVSENELKTLADNNNKFAFEIFEKLSQSEESNIFFSPYSISEVLALVYAGAKGETKTEMASVLHFDIDNEEQLHRSFNGLDLHLNYSDEEYTFSIANSLWPQSGYPIMDSYLDTLKVNYGAKIRSLDYKNRAKGSRETINNWIEDKTNGRIKDIIPQGSLNNSTRLVLTNAVYFKGQWRAEFSKSATQNDTFILLDGSTKQIPFMHQPEWYFDYMKSDNYQAINLPYRPFDEDKTSMLIIVPKNGKFENVLNNITSIYQETNDNISSTNINLKMPRFEFTTEVYQLNKYLIALGMSHAFLDIADFSNISNGEKIKIDSVSHKAFIKVDEKGTEAAAATVATAVAESLQIKPEPIDFYIDRPFIFFIKDNLTNQILFMGVIKDPNS